MPDATGSDKKLQFARIRAIARRQLPARQRARFLEFLGLYLESSVPQRAAQRSADDLFAIARHHWQMLQQRRPGKSAVRVFNPDTDKEGWRSPATVVQTVVEDMPFLVDSLTMAVHASGGIVQWLLHPVVAVHRTAKDGLRSLGKAGEAGGKGLESLVHIEFFPRLDEAGCRQLRERIESVLGDLRLVVNDHAAMVRQARRLVASLKQVPASLDPDEFAEVRALLEWLQENHFTFLAYTRTRIERRKNSDERFRTIPGSGLGLLRESRPGRDPEGYIAPAAEIDKYARSSRLLVISKGNARSHLHHPEFLDVISVKAFDADGRARGTHRFIGLFSAEAYASSPRLIPVLRRKVQKVMERSTFRERSHAYKSLLLVLETLPRDELIQSNEDELFQTAMGIMALRESDTLRLFMRRDRYGRFYACMVYMPRDRYSRDLRERIGGLLLEILGGRDLESHSQFVFSAFARIYYLIRTPPGTEISLKVEGIERQLLEASRTWTERLRDVLGQTMDAAAANGTMARFAGAFDAGYMEEVTPQEAAEDVRYLETLDGTRMLVPHLVSGEDTARPECLRLKLYVSGEPLVLSDILPLLENFGLRVLGQQLHPIRPADGSRLWVQEFEVHLPPSADTASESLRDQFEEAFLQVRSGRAENDGLNRLVLCAGLTWREAVLMRTVCRYLLQVGLPFSQAYMENQLAEHADLARKLVRLFTCRHDPALPKADRKSGQEKLVKSLEAGLERVESLDADRVLRAFLNVMRATLRSNFFQRGVDGEPKAHVTLKLDPRRIPELPKPTPMFETFVYAPSVEGIHLRGGGVARGGLRWSDRREDFRTEVLGLMKAQMVKNTIIVPVGAKGGFVAKKGPPPTEREAFLANGIECYKTFIRGLLDITDNLKDDKCVPPRDVIRHDGDDPYLVVAADKGTASFSDIANDLSAEYGFWLGDAFASGGSAGYDHKEMGITARGAWESVKRHFRELSKSGAEGDDGGKDIQKEDFTVVGIGDMSGDVFGNGMLLSRHIRLVAAFDHRHIFIDPDPNAETGFKERERLFGLPRSSWDDYNRSFISKGGGIWSRKEKRIKLSAEARKALGIEGDSFTPNELIHEILKAPVDLLWNGGIGTYVKSSHESALDVGDRANDAIRVNGRELRCKVVGEGGNLGCTQRGRIEYALAGGRINTDAIDNAGGVHSSDREVNIKIPLNRLMAQGRLKRKLRNKLLESMTEAVAGSVLDDNYIQSQAISLVAQDASTRLDEHANLIRSLERDGLLNRAIEYLPDEEALADRRSSGLGLTRPELAVLLAYAKMSLYDRLLDSGLPDDPWLAQALLSYFPQQLRRKHLKALESHRLRREIIATVLTNDIVNRMGMAFCQRLSEELGLPHAAIVRAYVIATEVFGVRALQQDIEALDNRVPAAVQYRAHTRVIGLAKHAVLWLLSPDAAAPSMLARAIERYRARVHELEGLLPELLPDSYRAEWEEAVERAGGDGIPSGLAKRLANARVLGCAPDIVELSRAAKLRLEPVADVYFQVGETFSIPWLLGAIIGLKAEGRWQALARATLREDVYRTHRKLVAQILAQGEGSPRSRLEAWRQANDPAMRFVLQRISEIQATGTRDYPALSVILREFRKLARLG